MITCYPAGAHLRLSCSELILCVAACEADTDCQTDCRQRARFQARTDLEALDNCRIGCDDDEEACRVLCGQEFAFCDP